MNDSFAPTVTVPEIERKFLVRSVPSLDNLTPDSIVQGYVMTGDSEVRVRYRNGHYVQTVKEGKGISRLETEEGVSTAMGAALLRVAGERTVEKRRYTFPQGWELDVYEGKLAGLVVVEIELSPVASSRRMAGVLAMPQAGIVMQLPSLPDGLALGDEVTEDKALKNQNLAGLSAAEAAALVARVAGKVTEGAECPARKR